MKFFKILFIASFLSLINPQFATAQGGRHGRPVLRPVKGESVVVEKFEGNAFTSVKCDAVSFLAIVMRGAYYYYAEIEISNKGQGPIVLDKDFLKVEKPDAIFRPVPVQLAAAHLAAEANVPFTPAPPPPAASGTTSTSQSSVIYTPNGAIVSETRSTAPSQEAQTAALANNLGNIFGAIAYQQQQKAAKKFLAFLVSTDEAYQSRELQGGDSKRFVFTFNKLSNSKSPIRVTLKHQGCSFSYHLKD